MSRITTDESQPSKYQDVFNCTCPKGPKQRVAEVIADHKDVIAVCTECNDRVIAKLIYSNVISN